MTRPDQKAKARLALAYAIAVVGSQRELAHRITLCLARASRGGAPLSLTAGAVHKWLLRSSMLAEDYWPAIEEITEYQVTRRHLRPDVFNGSPTAPLPEGRLLEQARKILSKYEADEVSA